jgi:TonB family protein
MGYGLVAALVAVAVMLAAYAAWSVLQRTAAGRRGPSLGMILRGEADGAQEEMPRLKNGDRIERLLAKRASQARIVDAAEPVLLRFRVTGAGRPKEIRVVRSSGNPAFDDVVARTVRQARYDRPRLYGRGVNVWVEQPFAFRRLG